MELKNLNFLSTADDKLDLIIFLKSSEVNTANSTFSDLTIIEANLGALFKIPSSPNIYPDLSTATI